MNDPARPAASWLRRTPLAMTGAALLIMAATPAGQGVGGSRAELVSTQVRLSPTLHPPVPSDLSAMWLASSEVSASLSPVLVDFVRGVRLLEEDGNAAAALPLLSAPAIAATPLADYARYYTGRALLRLERFAAADAAFGAVAARQIDSHLPEDAGFGQAEAKEGRKDFAGAANVYEALVRHELARPQAAWLKLGLAARHAGDRTRSLEALRRVYYQHPLTPEADEAAAALSAERALVEPGLARLELERAEALFAGRRWKAAKDSYERVLPYAAAPDRGRIGVHLAACNLWLKASQESRDALRAHFDGPLAAEARYHFVAAARTAGPRASYEALVRSFVADYPSSRRAEEVLNDLASALIIDNEDERADGVFRELRERFPAGRFTERATWKVGWWAYRHGRFSEAVQVFDRGAATFPRSDYRPPWLYWAGRAADQANDGSTAVARFTLAATDYYNSYYGRLALRRLSEARQGAVTSIAWRAPAPAQASVPSAARISLLLAVGLNREALSELVHAQRVWGDSPQLQATIALAQNRLGNLRAGINAMKRAYPQYLSAGGETLPSEIQRVIFPLDYWPLLLKYAREHEMDPYLLAALVAQESNFDPAVLSSARAVGLMQVLPSTGRAYARLLGIGSFSSRKLTDPDINVRIGTAVFSNAVRRFGGVHFALAAYNAGESRVATWQREKRGLPQDEFIDDIPFPETQNYVKRILGTAEDYRRLYGAGATH